MSIANVELKVIKLQKKKTTKKTVIVLKKCSIIMNFDNVKEDLTLRNARIIQRTNIDKWYNLKTIQLS